MLKINEIFKSIQGESTYAGLPFVFIRLSGCNLRCTYCDTKYAFTDGVELSLSEVIKQVENYNCHFVEITGGELLLQPDAVSLVSELCHTDYRVLVETNGSIDVSKLDQLAVKIIDIKCPGSGESNKNYWDNLKVLRPLDEIKFVVTSKDDYEWSKQILSDRIPEGQTVLFAPAYGKVKLEHLANWILEDNLQVRLQPQLQKFIWHGKERGV